MTPQSTPILKKNVHYTSVNDAIKLLLEYKKGAFRCKSDISEAYRIIPIHPQDYNKLGFTFEGWLVGLDLFNDDTCPSGHISRPTQVNVSQTCFNSLNMMRLCGFIRH